MQVVIRRVNGFSKQVEDVFSGTSKKKPDYSQEEYAAKMAELRQEIDYCNKTATDLLLRRVEASRRVAICKWSAGKPNFDAGREQAIIEAAGNYAKERGMPSEWGEKLVGLMLALARKDQDEYRERLERQ